MRGLVIIIIIMGVPDYPKTSTYNATDEMRASLGHLCFHSTAPYQMMMYMLGEMP